MSTTFSIAFQTNKPLAEYGYLAAQIESYGFDSVSVYNDMLYQPAWLPLLDIARHTKHIQIGPAAINPFTCHPINIAGHIALIDEASHGRAYCGFARGAWLETIGLAVSKPITAVSEAMVCVRHLLGRSRAPLPGQIFPLTGGESLRWQPLRPDIPFLLGSWGPAMIRRCLPHITAVKLGGSANPGAAAWLKSLLKGHDIDIVIGAVTVVDEDGEAARQLARREVALYLPVVAGLDPSLAIEPDRLAGIRAAMKSFDVETAVGFISDEILSKFAFAGSAKDVINQATLLMEAGVDRIEFGTPHGLSTQSGLRLLGEVVLPHLKRISL